MLVRSARLVLIVASAAACTVAGPTYVRPEIETPAAMAGARPSQAAAPWTEWWKEFHDPQLDRLVTRAREGNLDLRAAAERVRAARIAARAAGAPADPRLSIGGGYTRSRQSENQIGGSAREFANLGDPEDDFHLTADASWEIDLWGRVRRTAEAASADAEAQEEDRLAMEVALVADLAEAWFDLSEAAAEAAIHRETVDLLERTRAIVQQRVDAGMVAEIDVHRTESDIASARSRIPDAERRGALAQHRISLLLGQAPGAKFAAPAPSAFREPAEVPLGLPAQLLDRRPDLRAAERRIRAANARVGAAIADFYVRVTLFGRAGVQSVSPDTFLHWSSRAWSIGPGFELPILDGGAREFEELRAEAERDAATAEWVAAFTRALSEVADGIVGVESRRAVRERLREAVTASRRTVELSEMRYREGLTGNLEVLDAQRDLARARLALVLTERECLSEVVRLCRALGGGWQTEPQR